MPPFLDQFVLAGSATQNQTTWDLAAASWDTLTAQQVPLQTEFALLVSVLLAPDEAIQEHSLSVTLRGPDGNPIGGMSAQIAAALGDVQAPLERHRAEAVLKAQGVVFPEYGRYELHIDWDETPLREPMILGVVPPEG